jgi:hypothetical protein
MILFEIENKVHRCRAPEVRDTYLLAAPCAQTAVKAAEIVKSPGPSAAVILLIIECGENRSSAELGTYT